MDLGIQGKKAIINGGSAGLGRGAALALAREGVDVFISARNQERLENAAEKISIETGSVVTPIVADHSTEQGRSKILAACPQPDILVGTCSPPTFTTDFRDIPAEEWHNQLAMSLISPIEFMRAVVDGMADRKFGRIVNITTVASKFPLLSRVMSGPPRAALSNYTTAISKAVAKDNVTINNLLPGMHHTEGIEVNFRQQAKDRGIDVEDIEQEWINNVNIASNRFGDPDDFGNLCAMLCSQQANYIVGQDIVVDGGACNTTF